jgi:hypothetical protein
MSTHKYQLFLSPKTDELGIIQEFSPVGKAADFA